MTEIIFMVEDSPEGGVTARALGYSIFTEAENREELKQKIRDAIECHFDNGDAAPRVVRLHYVTEEVFSCA